MGFKIARRNSPYVLLASATSAQDARRESAWFNTDFISKEGGYIACTAVIVTASVLATFSVEVTNDGGTTVYEAKPTNNPAYVGTAAGAGTTRVALELPSGISAFKQLRAVAVLSGAATAAGDLTSVDLIYLKPSIIG